MAALQRLQQQSASLHQQFLYWQNASHGHYHTLLQQQQRFLDMSMGLPVVPLTPMAALPVEVPVIPASVQPAADVTPPQAAQVVARTHVVVPTSSGAAGAASEVPTTRAQAESAVADSQPATGGVDVAKILLEIVADKTGYPVDVLDLKMELDADLGIDSIKRVEILSALQDELPDAPKVGPDQLGTLRTLQSLLDLMPVEVASAAPANAPEVAAEPGATRASDSGATAEVATVLLDIVAEKTG
jgi:acyl carrier protein